MSPIYETDCYLQIQRRVRRWRNGTFLAPIKVAAVTQDRPDVLLPGAVLVKIHVRIPAEAWEPLTPTGQVDVQLPDHLITTSAVPADQQEQPDE